MSSPPCSHRTLIYDPLSFISGWIKAYRCSAGVFTAPQRLSSACRVCDGKVLQSLQKSLRTLPVTASGLGHNTEKDKTVSTLCLLQLCLSSDSQTPFISSRSLRQTPDLCPGSEPLVEQDRLILLLETFRWFPQFSNIHSSDSCGDRRPEELSSVNAGV